MKGPSIDIAGVSLTLGNTQVLENVDLHIAAGEIHCLIGPNGGGKTSLVRTLLGQMPHTGTVTVAWAQDRTLGYVPQFLDFDKTLPISVQDFMAIVCQRRPAFFGPGAATRKRMDAALDRVGLSGKRDRKIGSLSGGERQRVLFAQALIPEPALLLLDEPMTGLDDTGSRIFEQVVRSVADAGTTIVWIAHDLDQVARMANSVTCLNRRIQFQGPAAAVMTNDNIRRAFSSAGITGAARATAAQASA